MRAASGTPAGMQGGAPRSTGKGSRINSLERADRDRHVATVLADLRARGLRVTTARRVLLEALYDASGHKTADELAAAVQERAPDVHLSTIYRNLDELERLGLVVHAHLGHGPATYHLAASAHGHFACETCGAMWEAPDELFGNLAVEALARYGFAIDPHHFAVIGLCSACRMRR